MPVAFTLFWSCIVLLFDGLMVHGIYKQLESRHFPAATGTIISSEVTTHHTSKGGTSYNAAVTYRFTVDGKYFEGSRIRFGMTVSSRSYATSIVNAHPSGSTVQIFYNPANPQESVLSPGLEGLDLVLAMFLTPFNMVMFGMWLWACSWLRERFFKPVAGGVKIMADGGTTRVRLPQFPAILWGLITTGTLGFISIFAVGFGAQMQPSIPLALSVIAAVYLSGIAVFFWQQLKINSGIDDLILNESARTLELPLTFGRSQRITVNVADIQSLAVQKILHRNNKGRDSYTYAPTLCLTGTDAPTQKLADWSDKLKADEFAGWLRQQLNPNLPATMAIDEAQVESQSAAAASQKAFEEIQRDGKSKIKISDGPNGREFYFPPARNVGTALVVTLFMFLFNGVTALIYHLHAPIIFTIIFGACGIFLFIGAFGLWTKSSRVAINSTVVRRTNRWLIFSRTREFPVDGVARFATAMGAQSGSKIFTDIKLIPRGSDEKFAANRGKFQEAFQAAGVPGTDKAVERFRALSGPRGFTVAGSIENSAEANWLVEEMNKALHQTQPGAGYSPAEETGAPKAINPGVAILVSLALACGVGYWFLRRAHSVPPAPQPAQTPESAAPRPAQPQPAVTDVAFSSFGSHSDYETNGWLVEADGHADWFVSRSTGRLKAIELKIEPASQPTKKLAVSIFEDRGGVPGRSLEMLSVARQGSTNSAGWLVLDSRKQPALETGAKYWVWARSPAGTWYWHFNSQNLMQEGIMHSPQPQKWATAGYTNVCAFDVLTERNR